MKICRFYHGLVAFDTKLFAVGGISDERSETSSVECYNSIADTWCNLADLPQRLSGMAVCSTLSGNCIFCFVGKNGCVDGKMDRILIYKVARDIWTNGDVHVTYLAEVKTFSLIKDLITVRSNINVALLYSMIYVFGGNYDDDQASTIDVYDISENRWHQIGKLEQKRSQFCGSILKL